MPQDTTPSRSWFGIRIQDALLIAMFGAMIVLAGVTALLANGQPMYRHARQIYRLGMSYPREALFTDQLPLRVLSAAGREAMAIRAHECFHCRYDMRENAKTVVKLFGMSNVEARGRDD